MAIAVAPGENLGGDHYHHFLGHLHRMTNHESYLEIGTFTGATLAIAQSPSIAIDPNFQINVEVVGSKPLLHLYQMESDRFFNNYDAIKILGKPVAFAFLDGMHQCEFLLRDFINTEPLMSAAGVIAMHDCIPLDIPMTDRIQDGTPPAYPQRLGWWTGDVWKAAVAIKRHRPDLKVFSLDCQPTGLIVIAGLDPLSTVLKDNYDSIVSEMQAMDLEIMTVEGLHQELELRSTHDMVEEQFADLQAARASQRIGHAAQS